MPRRNSRGGRSAAEHLVAALRCVYQHAEDDGMIGEADNPARKVAKPRRLPSTRRAVADTRLAEINQVAATTGNDPDLDTLLLRLHTETACRRGGALALRPPRPRPGPVPGPAAGEGRDGPLAAGLAHPDGPPRPARPGAARPAGRAAAALPNGKPITSRRYDHLWSASAGTCPGRTQQVSMHWIRHTTLTWVERNFGYAVARAYAGHTDCGSDAGATSTYVRASSTKSPPPWPR